MSEGWRGPPLFPPRQGFFSPHRKKKMDIFAAFATDETLETEGKWFPLSKKAKIRVARSGNPNYVNALRAKMKENQLDLSTGDEADQLAEEILIDVMAETILLGWEHLEFQGKPIAYSRDSARTLLRVKDFRKKVASLSEGFESFRLKAEEDQGND